MRIVVRALGLIAVALTVGSAWAQAPPSADEVLKLLRGGGCSTTRTRQHPLSRYSSRQRHLVAPAALNVSTT